MLSRIRHFFREHIEIHVAVDGAESQRVDVSLAAAALLVEVGRADFDYDRQEQAHIAELIGDTLGVAAEDVAQLQSMAEAEAESATSLHQFTSLVHEHFDAAQKAALMEALWRVAFADGQVDKHESHVIRRIADLLYMPQEVYVRTRQRVEESLSS